MGGMARHNGRGALLTSNLPQLQNLIKRDPAGYKEEFLAQWNHYESMRRLFELNPDEEGGRFREVLGFIAQVSQCYPAETKEFPSHLSSLLLDHHATLSPDTRKSIIQNLIMLRNKDVIQSIDLLRTLFPLLSILTSSQLRSSIRKTILTDIRTANAKTKNHKLNRMVQALLFGMVERGMGGDAEGSRVKGKGKKIQQDAKGGEAMWAVVLVKELWRKGVWNDPKSVAIVALACNHPNTKVQSAAIHFFLGSENEEEDSEDEVDEGPDLRKLQHQAIINKKTKSRDKALRAAVKTKGQKRRENAANAGVTPNFPALQLLNDPQSFGEKLYDGMSKHDKVYALEHKVLIMQLLSRVMGAHKLCILGFYSYIIKYLTYHQLSITLILVSLAQSVHDLTPPDVLTPVIRKIATEFVHPGVGSEVVAAGLNGIREICRRQPWCMEEDLLGDLIEYRKSRDKGVVTAARGLLQLFREVNPGLLKRRERGKAASMGLTSDQVPEFGHQKSAPSGIDGLELLEDYLKKQSAEGDGDEAGSQAGSDAGWDDWEAESEAESDDSGGWQNVMSDSEDEVDISDSDDDEEEKTRREKKRAFREKRSRDLNALQEAEEDNENMQDSDADEEEEKEKVSLAAPAETRFSALASQKILTPADFALLNTLRIAAATEAANAGGGSAAKRKLALLEANKKTNSSGAQDDEVFLSEGDILGPRKRAKENYEERMARIAEGREGREKFGSAKGKKKAEAYTSSTNKDKRKNKPLMMAVHSRGVVMKKKQSLREKQQNLRKHIEKQKSAF
ncbi:sda1-domain-containing protein [Phaffia rhodozyma]|uniref:Protein SDA1 n=1 Tax=Phaffia rhodozyma TaxID=264483 RepID=A0A0F7SIR8_PHARH|nr:sda1-domain-containing protein [Phaffia rhodozyma]